VFAGAAHPFYALGIPLGASLSAMALTTGRAGRRRRAFGPYLAAGAALSLTAGPWWVSEVGARVLWR
jgi:prepilin signal peptidase PulO-like enzyme (type II secretory pathway)